MSWIGLCRVHKGIEMNALAKCGWCLERQIKDESNYTIWDGYLDTPISFNPLGDNWIGNLEPNQTLKDWIDDNTDYLLELIEVS